jgi:hypothetical protein
MMPPTAWEHSHEKSEVEAELFGSTESRDRRLLLVIDLEERKQPAHAQGLQDDLGWIHELERSAGFLGQLETFDEEADAAGVEAVDVGHAEHDLDFAVGDEIFKGLAQVVGGRSENQPSMQRDGCDFTVFQNADVQPGPSDPARPLFSLTHRGEIEHRPGSAKEGLLSGPGNNLRRPQEKT